MAVSSLQVSRRQRATPYTSRVEALGVTGFSVVNHTILPKGFSRSVDEDYWHLKQQVQLWDVGCQRRSLQIAIPKLPPRNRLTGTMGIGHVRYPTAGPVADPDQR